MVGQLTKYATQHVTETNHTAAKITSWIPTLALVKFSLLLSVKIIILTSSYPICFTIISAESETHLNAVHDPSAHSDK